ncbi:hypothetical protein BJ973_004381 [Actinoplanes tereljensis]|uniref:DUF916 domain-containing protein n=1 Tax=Paractinoplanes tereljensis TaxID=571912 RepID=A0A919NRJ2_9ACTN|nr:hypothetical protein [Actinoplanes tereljensis]GIF23770.1 hypothetical protein Ate02nite_65000 [Actinoplanes tereljensis]
MIVQVLAAVLLAATPVHADTGPKVTWTVQPADGGRWIERTLDPGQQVTERLAVRNLGTVPAVFALSAADGYLTDNGHFNMLASDQKSKDGGTWIAVQSSVAVGAGKTQIVPFTITVPAGATPGDHPAGIAASVLSRSGTVQVESRVGFRVMLRASGIEKSQLAAQAVTVHYEQSWNPFRAGTIRAAYTVANTGNVRADARTSVSVGELFGLHHRDGGATAGELLPGGNRPADARVHGVWGLGPVHTRILLTPADPAGPTEVTVWILPWPQLIAVVLLVALLFVLRATRRASRRRLARLLDDARREGQALRKDNPS